MLQIAAQMPSADGILEREVLTLRPSILAVFLARNKAHVLPYFLGYFEHQRYPKDRISVWIYSDHNQDDTELLLRRWKDAIRGQYRRVELHSIVETLYTQTGVNNWPKERFLHLLRLRDRALNVARERDIDYVLYIDVDNLLVNPNTLSELIAQKRDIVSPMIEPLVGSVYSNFWCGVTDKGYYKRTEEYIPTLHRARTGCFEVPMVHSTYIVDMRSPGVENFTFIADEDYNGVVDDLLVFAYQVKKAGMSMFVLNTQIFARMPPPSHDYSSLDDERKNAEELCVNYLAIDGPVVQSEYLPYNKPTLTDFGLDKIYVINLHRREGRRLRLKHVLQHLGIQAEFVTAVDGRNLTDKDLKEFGIQMLDGYLDPLKKRPLTVGEIGCFLSHHRIWAEVVSSQFTSVLILEDDPYFYPQFREKFSRLLEDVRNKEIDWELIYLARKRLENTRELKVENTETLVRPGYSYWALAYMLSQSGAKKLINQQPLGKMMPVDEYLPLMFDRHPRKEWKAHFTNRNLKAFSAQPLLIRPTHYTSNRGYISDVETLDTELKQQKDEL
ncbi:procollagen galactosyltransferase 2-like [Corticium candelabrum]|uniref:procollagen galactosyltransferase 2-like n=1 Tax=Corticium candelabrum TaxID=121492 RepID=UPI002E25D791|nr:procollagen galactosyltransferase 2-like [Corticium candelabrum]